MPQLIAIDFIHIKTYKAAYKSTYFTGLHDNLFYVCI